MAIGFVPYVGPTLDLCEAVTGKLFCLPGGKELSLEERVFSGVGFGGGALSKAWSGVKNTGVNPGAKAVAQGVLSLGEEFALALQASRRSWYKTLHGRAGTIANEFEAKAGLYLMKTEGRAMIGVGDGGVRKVLDILEGLPDDLSKAPDFLSATKGNKLALSEVKGGNVSISKEVLPQLANAMNKLKELGLAGDVERVELIMKKGALIKDQDFKVLDGYLVKISESNNRVTLKGFKNFIQVILL